MARKSYSGPPPMVIDPAKKYVATFHTDVGDFQVELFAAQAPQTVNNFVFLVREGFYNNTTFHRVIRGFMAQGGDPTGTGTGGPGKHLKAEFSREPHGRGTCSMARAQSPDSADSQFFICFEDAAFLNGKYTVWGKVVDGMDAI